MKFSKIFLISLIGCFLVILPLTTHAIEQKADQSIYISSDEIIEGNFIRAGNIIEINGAVNGDVIVAGNMITINGPIAGDVIAAGNIIKVSGEVGGSVRAAGSTVEVGNKVEKNVWALGANVILSENSEVSWDLFAGAASIIVRGPVKRSVWVSGASVVIDNEIGKDVTAALDQDGQIILNPGAKITGNLIYHAASPSQLVLKEGAEVSGETTQKSLAQRTDVEVGRILGTAYLFFKMVSFFSLLIVGLILISLIPKKVLEVKNEMIKRPGPSLGWGVVYFFLIPIITLLLFFTVIGIPLALIVIPFYLIALYIAKILAGFTIGLVIFNKFSKDKEKFKGSLIWPLILGLIIIIVVTSIPIFGWLLKLFLIWWALGAIASVKKETLKEYR